MPSRKHIHGIAINNMLFVFPFIPLLIIAGINTINEKAINYLYTETIFYKYGFIAEILGIVLLLVALPTIFYKLYSHWYALADE